MPAVINHGGDLLALRPPLQRQSGGLGELSVDTRVGGEGDHSCRLHSAGLSGTAEWSVGAPESELTFVLGAPPGSAFVS